MRGFLDYIQAVPDTSAWWVSVALLPVLLLTDRSKKPVVKQGFIYPVF
jgi:hypothetical protein